MQGPEDIPQAQRFYGVYYGIVESNKDPLNLGRLKVRVSIYGPSPEDENHGIPTPALPWAHPSLPSGGSKDAGYWFIPPEGAQVVVSFVGGHPWYPVWVGTSWGGPDGESEVYADGIVASQPDGWEITKYHSITTPYGHRVELDDNSDVNGTNYAKITIITKQGYYLRLSEEKKHVEIKTVDGRVATFDDDNDNILIASPENPPFRLILDSRRQVVDIRSHNQHFVNIDDKINVVDFGTAGSGNNPLFGYRVALDQGNRRVIIKGDANQYGYLLQESNGSPSPVPVEMGFYSNVLNPSGSGTALRILRDQTSNRDLIAIISGNGQIANPIGVVLDPVSTEPVFRIGDRGLLSPNRGIQFFPRLGRIVLGNLVTANTQLNVDVPNGTFNLSAGSQGIVSGPNITIEAEALTVNARSFGGSVAPLNMALPAGGDINAGTAVLIFRSGGGVLRLEGGSLTSRYFSHTHSAGTFTNGGGAVTGVSGPPIT